MATSSLGFLAIPQNGAVLHAPSDRASASRHLCSDLHTYNHGTASTSWAGSYDEAVLISTSHKVVQEIPVPDETHMTSHSREYKEAFLVVPEKTVC